MIPRDIISVLFVTFYLIIFIELLLFSNSSHYAMLMWLFSPLLIIWMVYTVLRNGRYNGPEPGEEEFGYQDKKKDDLGVF